MKTNKSKLIIPSTIIFSVLFILYLNNLMGLNIMDSKIDYVPNKETAIKIAEAIWLPIYGERILEKKPFNAKLDEKRNVWIVEGTLKESKGGVPYIEIQKKDCKILKVYHGK